MYPNYLSTYLPIISISLSTTYIYHLYIYPSIHLSINLLSLSLSTIYVCLSIYRSSTCLSLHLSIHSFIRHIHSYHSQPGVILLPKGHLSMFIFLITVTAEELLASSGWRPGTLLYTPYMTAPPQSMTRPQMSAWLRVRALGRNGEVRTHLPG